MFGSGSLWPRQPCARFSGGYGWEGWSREETDPDWDCVGDRSQQFSSETTVFGDIPLCRSLCVLLQAKLIRSLRSSQQMDTWHNEDNTEQIQGASTYESLWILGRWSGEWIFKAGVEYGGLCRRWAVFIVTVCGCFVANNTMVGWARDLVDIARTPEIARQTELKCAGW